MAARDRPGEPAASARLAAEVVEPARVAERGARDADARERVRAQLVEAERARPSPAPRAPTRIASSSWPSAMRNAGEAGQHVRLRRRGRRVREQLRSPARSPASVVVAAALHPGHVGERRLGLGGGLALAGGEQRVAGLLDDLGAPRPRRGSARGRSGGAAVACPGRPPATSSTAARVEARRGREGVQRRGAVAGLAQREPRAPRELVGRLAGGAGELERGEVVVREHLRAVVGAVGARAPRSTRRRGGASRPAARRGIWP